jgi:hypothetical protein
MTFESFFQLVFSQLEGPYKWYALLFIAAVITAVVTRFVFKTLKWVLLIGALVIMGFYVWTQFFG